MLLYKTDGLWICKNNRELVKRKKKKDSRYFYCSKSLVTRTQLGVIIKLTKHTETRLKHFIWEKFCFFCQPDLKAYIHVVISKYWNTGWRQTEKISWSKSLGHRLLKAEQAILWGRWNIHTITYIWIFIF